MDAYIVTQAPKHIYRDMYVTFVAVVDATTKKGAIAQVEFRNEAKFYKAPTAELLVKGRMYRF